MTVFLAAFTPLASADTVTDWNRAFLIAVQSETTPPPLASRNLAILHVTMFDAVNAVNRIRVPYHFSEKTCSETDPSAAAAGAGHQVAISLFPSHKAAFDELLDEQLAGRAEEPNVISGLALGRRCADLIIALRAGDGSTTSVPYIPSQEPGRWRRTPPTYRPPELPQWHSLKPFALTNGAQFRPPPPPPLDSDRWTQELAEVREIGSRISKTRTREQTEIAHFWSDFSYTVTPPGHWNEIARAVSSQRGLSLEENARLFALLNIALADAAIVAWDAKYAYDFWRPVTAIREADRDGHPSTEPDPSWESLLPSPPFPEYPSGHSTFSGAATGALHNRSMPNIAKARSDS